MKKQLKAGIHTNRENNSVHTTRPNKLHKIAKAVSSNTEHTGITYYSSQRSKQYIKCVATVEPNKQHHLLQEHRNTSTQVLPPTQNKSSSCIPRSQTILTLIKYIPKKTNICDTR